MATTLRMLLAVLVLSICTLYPAADDAARRSSADQPTHLDSGRLTIPAVSDGVTVDLSDQATRRDGPHNEGDEGVWGLVSEPGEDGYPQYPQVYRADQMMAVLTAHSLDGEAAVACEYEVH